MLTLREVTCHVFSQLSSVAQPCPTLCDPMNRSTPGLPIHHQFPEITQTRLQWVGDDIQPSHLVSPPSPPAPNPSQHQGLFQWVNSSHEVASFSSSSSPSNEHPGLISFRMDWLDLLAVKGTLKSLLQHHSSKASIFQCSAFFTVQLSHPYMTTGKTITLTRRTFVGKVISLVFGMLSRLVITFLPKSKCLLISWLQSPSAVILEPPKIKSDTVSAVSSSISHEVMGPDAVILGPLKKLWKGLLPIAVWVSHLKAELLAEVKSSDDFSHDLHLDSPSGDFWSHNYPIKPLTKGLTHRNYITDIHLL